MRTTAGGLAAGLLLSPKLWFSRRFYPLTPVLPFLPPIPHPLDQLMYWALVVLLTIILVLPQRSEWVMAASALAMIMAFFDQSRWQPWFYQYLFMLVALGLSLRMRFPDAALNTCRLIIVSIYFWSGLQKAGSSFANDVFPWVAQPLTNLLPAFAKPAVPLLGFAAPFLETAVGAGLLFRRTRRVAIIAALAMHVFILIGIGPLGHTFNIVVWPWNVAMMIFVPLLFWNAGEISFRDVLWGRDFPFQRVALLLFGIAPLFSFFGLWDSYLSSELYAGNRNAGRLIVSDALFERLPEEIQAYVTEDQSGVNELRIMTWSFGELNVPAYPEVRIYKNVARTVCRYARAPEDVKLVIDRKPVLFWNSPTLSYACSSL